MIKQRRREYDQEMLHCQTIDKSMAPRGKLQTGFSICMLRMITSSTRSLYMYNSLYGIVYGSNCVRSRDHRGVQGTHLNNSARIFCC